MAAPAAAQERLVDLPSGTLAAAVAALSAQAGVSVAVPEPALWRRRVAGVHGRMDAGSALRRLLKGSGARAVRVGQGAWRIQAAAPLAPGPFHAVAPAKALVALAPADDIVVVASKWNARLSEYPGTVSTIDGRDLARHGDTSTGAVLDRLATVSSTHLGAGRNKLFIRGIADSSFTGPTQATVGQYLGDVRLTYNAPDPDLRLYDIRSVEVLEGPQGTLYGAGSLGGIVRIVRNAPNLAEIEGALAGGASATWHGAPGADLGGMLNVPIVNDRVALRLVGYGITDGGYIDDTLRRRSDINRTSVGGGRAMLRVAPVEGLTVDLGVTGQATHGDDSQYADRDAPPLTRSSRIAQGFGSDYWLGELVVHGRIGALDLLSSSGLARQTLDERFDASKVDGPPRLFRQRNATRLWSSENRVSRPMRDGWGGVIGVSWLHNETVLDRALGTPDLPLPATGVANRIDELTLYGEGSVQLMRQLTLTAGGRISHARLSGSGEDVSPFVALAQASVTAQRTETSVLPSLAVSAVPIRGLTLFARYQQGFRPGGLAIEGDFVRRFDSDRVTTLETGLRHGVPGHSRFDLAVSASHTRWRDIQADFVDAGGLPSTANIGDGRIFSLSATGGASLAKGLRAEAGLALNDSRVTNPSEALRMMFALGRIARIPNIAGVVARGALSYEMPLAGERLLTLEASARYTGKSRLGVGPVLGAEQGNYVDTRLFARLGLRGFGVSAGVTNVLDQVGNRFALGTPFVPGQTGQITPLRPRTIRLGVDTSF